jgi:hypothetical protein
MCISILAFLKWPFQDLECLIYVEYLSFNNRTCHISTDSIRHMGPEGMSISKQLGKVSNMAFFMSLHAFSVGWDMVMEKGHFIYIYHYWWNICCCINLQGLPFTYMKICVAGYCFTVFYSNRNFWIPKAELKADLVASPAKQHYHAALQLLLWYASPSIIKHIVD